MNAILVFFHCRANTGYAIGRLERVFLEVARGLVESDERVHFAYPSVSAGDRLPIDSRRVIEFDSTSSAHLDRVEQYVRQHGIDIALGFDQPVRRPGYAALRRGGVRTLVSYWGAAMSSLNTGVKLALKRLDVLLARNGPNHYIFESVAMQQTAVAGRGIPPDHTSVSYLGVDADLFRPARFEPSYAHEVFGIPRERRIVYYSGHMEERKGVRVLINAAVDLVDRLQIRDVHFLLLGNRPGEEAAFYPAYRGRVAETHITFGGYRDDVSMIIPGCYAGAIPSTGWDSFTLSSLEIASCGLPLVVSKIPGLDETVDEPVTGLTFPPGNASALAATLARLLTDPHLRDSMGDAARTRVLQRFTVQRQIESLMATIRRVDASR